MPINWTAGFCHMKDLNKKWNRGKVEATLDFVMEAQNHLCFQNKEGKASRK